jgi:hypothetical protein
MRDHSHTLSDFLAATLSIECEPCSRRGRYNVAKLMQQHGDRKLPSPCTCSQFARKARSVSVFDRCKAVYGNDSRWSTLSLEPS